MCVCESHVNGLSSKEDIWELKVDYFNKGSADQLFHTKLWDNYLKIKFLIIKTVFSLVSKLHSVP